MQLERERPAFTPPPCFEGSSATTATEATDDRHSFASTEGSPHLISAAEEPERPEAEDDEFEFSFMVGNPELGSDFNVADEIFSNGQIRPVYPVFNRDLLLAAGGEADGDAEGEKDEEKAIRLPLRRLLIEDREACSRSGSVSSTSSSADDLEGIAPVTYCVWNPGSVPPSPDRCKKSSSTGSRSRKWRIRDLVVGRSHSDGKEKFLYLAPPEKEKRPSPDASSAAKGKGAMVVKDGKKKGGKVTEVDMVTAHQLYYAKGGDGGARRSFLPYKIGFFTNVNGLSQTHRPF